MHYGHAATGYTENADGTVTVHFTGHPSATARFVVAADGIRSAIRRQVCPSNSGPRYLGHMIFNALLFNPGGIKVCSHSPGSVDVFMEAEDSISAVLSDGVGGYAYWAVRLSSQEVDLTNGKHGGLGIPGSKARVLQALATRPTWSNLAAVVAATEEGAIFERPLFDLLPLSSWSAAGGRVVLLGDSAHAMSPNAGQGASMAFEDAHTLCEELQRCVDGQGLKYAGPGSSDCDGRQRRARPCKQVHCSATAANGCMHGASPSG